MKTAKASATFLIFCALLVLSGCHKNKPVVLLPQQPPTTASTENPPSQPPQNPQDQPQTQPPTATGQEQANADKPPAKPVKPQPRHPRHTTSTATNKGAPPAANPPEKTPADKPQEVAHNTPPRIVVQDGGSSNSGSTQIAAGAPHDDKTAHEQTTGQLLDSTDNNLRSIKRQLSADEQTRVAQIRDYQTQARQAVKDGDMVGAHNLAVKAHVLSEELVKQR